MPCVLHAVRLGGPRVPLAPNARGEPPRHVRTAAEVKAPIGAVGSSALLGPAPAAAPRVPHPRCGPPQGRWRWSGAGGVRSWPVCLGLYVLVCVSWSVCLGLCVLGLLPWLCCLGIPVRVRNLPGPNAALQARGAAGARYERRLFPVACKRVLECVGHRHACLFPRPTSRAASTLAGKVR